MYNTLLVYLREAYDEVKAFKMLLKCANYLLKLRLRAETASRGDAAPLWSVFRASLIQTAIILQSDHIRERFNLD